MLVVVLVTCLLRTPSLFSNAVNTTPHMRLVLARATLHQDKQVCFH